MKNKNQLDELEKPKDEYKFAKNLKNEGAAVTSHAKTIHATVSAEEGYKFGRKREVDRADIKSYAKNVMEIYEKEKFGTVLNDQQRKELLTSFDFVKGQFKSAKNNVAEKGNER